MLRQGTVVLREDYLSLPRMRGNSLFEIVTDKDPGDSSVVAVHVDMALQPVLLIHAQTWLHVGHPAVDKIRTEKVHGHFLSGVPVKVMHCRPGPVHLDPVPRLVMDVVRELVGSCEPVIIITELRVSHGHFAVVPAVVAVFLMQELESHSRFQQLFVHIFVVHRCVELL